MHCKYKTFYSSPVSLEANKIKFGLSEWRMNEQFVAEWTKPHKCTTETNLVKVDGHGAVAHLWRFMVGVTNGRKRHPAGSWPHRHAQSITWWLRRRGGVAHHQTLSLQHDWLCVVLATDLWWPPKDQKQKSDEEDWAGREVGQRERRWTGHSSKWGWALGVLGFCWCPNLQQERVFLKYTSLLHHYLIWTENTLTHSRISCISWDIKSFQVILYQFLPKLGGGALQRTLSWHQDSNFP